MSSIGRRVFVFTSIGAAALTLAAMQFPRVSELPGIETALAFGVILGSVPFGGLHSNPPELPLMVIACMLNALLWGGIASGGVAIFTGIHHSRHRPS